MKACSTLSSIFLYILFSYPLKGYSKSEYQRNDSVAKYYFYKNKAELAIVDSNYKTSIGFFKKAYQFKSPNPRELSNGLRVALILKDTLFARRCIDELTVNGLKKNATLGFMGDELTESGSLYSFLSESYDSLLTVFNNSDKPRIAILLDSVYERDQAIRRRKHTDEQMIEVDKNNVDSVIWFAHKYGFPDYHLLGFAGPESGLGIGGIYWFILWHARLQDISKLDSIGLSAVMQGLYPPDEYAQAVDCKAGPCKYHMLIPGIAAELGNSKPVLSDETVNKNRSEIYLESIEDYKKKLIFMHNQKKNWFQFLLVPQFIFGMNFAK